MFCTVSSMESGIPTHPVSFTAHFYKTKFVLAVASLDLENPDSIPPATGTYTYSMQTENTSILKMKQVDVNVNSVLLLKFSHSNGGTLCSTVYENDNIVAKQLGMFHVCSDIVSEGLSKPKLT